MFRLILLGSILVAGAPSRLVAQRATPPSILGTWRFDLNQGDKKEGPRTVIVRDDSSASYGEETARWRIVDDSLWLAMAGYRHEQDVQRRRQVPA